MGITTIFCILKSQIEKEFMSRVRRVEKSGSSVLQGFIKKLKESRYIAFFISIIFLAITSASIQLYTLEKQANDARIINTAGRQRMLSQRIAKRVLYCYVEFIETGLINQSSIDTIHVVCNEFKSTHNYLLSQVKINNNSEVNRLLINNSPNLDQLTNAALKSIRSSDKNTFRHYIDIIQQNERKFLVQQEQLINLMVKSSENKIAIAKKVEIILTTLMVLLILLSFRYLISPLIKQLRDSNQVLEKNSTATQNIANQLHAILQSAPLSIISTDNYGLIITFNKGAEALLGYSSEETVGNKYIMEFQNDLDLSIKDQLYVETPDQLEKRSAWLIALSEKSMGQISHYTYIRKDDQPLEIELVTTKITDRSGIGSGYLFIASNITEQKRSKEILRQTSMLAKVGGWELNLKTNKLSWTDTTKDIHEVTSSYEPELSSAIRFYEEGESRNRITKLVNVLIEKGEKFDAEFKIITAKGTEKWIRSKGQGEFYNGSCIRIFGVIQDISQEKAARKSLADSEEMFRQVFNNAFTGMALVNEKGRATKVNKSLCRMLGYSEEEMLAMNMKDHTHPEDLEENLRTLDEFNTGLRKQVQFEKRFIHKNGSIVWGIVSVSLIQDLNGNNMQIVQVTDISRNHEAELKIKEERRLLETIINNVPINIFVKDIHSKKVLVNKYELKYLGAKKPEEVLGKDDFDLYPEEVAKTSIAEDQEIILSGEPFLNRETVNTKLNGETSYFLTSKIPLRNESGQITGLLGISFDITKTKEDQKTLQDLNQKVSEQNIRLINFAHIVSHNLRSHAGNFATLLDILKIEKDPSQRAVMFDLLQNASSNLSETVNHLTEIALVNTHEIDRLQSFNLKKALITVQDNIKALIIQNDVTCVNNVDENIFIQAVPAYLDSILLNLFTNAVKYRSPDRKLIIRLWTTFENQYVTLYFADNGIGIDLEKHGNKLFGMYKTFHGNKDATGIGLFITKNQIESMGGKIEVESLPENGTTFKIRFMLPQDTYMI